MMIPELRLVLALCRTPLADAARNLAQAIIAGPVNWDRVLSVARAFEVEPVFCSNLIALSGATIPDDVLDMAAIRERESRAFALAGTLVLVDLVARLENAGIPVIVLKGPALGVTAYGDASMRTFRDIDLLVRREDVLRARDLLLELGYERDYEPDSEIDLLSGDHALEFSRSGIKVELHGALLERYLRFDLGNDAIWDNAAAMDLAGHRVKVLDSPRLLVFICAHGAKHEWTRTRWICDVAQLAARASPGEVSEAVRIASAARARGILALGLRLASEVFGQDIPAFGVQTATPGIRTEALADRVQRRLGLREDAAAGEGWLDRIEPGASALFFWSRTRESWIDRLVSVMRVVFVPTEKDRPAGSLAWITRPVRLSARFARQSFLGRDSRQPQKTS
jgi:hypothetical protein